MSDSSKDPWKFPRGTRAVVTDGSSAIGAAVIEELSKKGAKILTCGPNEAQLQQMVKDWKHKGLKVEGVAADLSFVVGRQSFADVIRIWLRGKTLDILVNNFQQKSCVDDEKNQFHASSMLTRICHEHLKRFPGNGTSSVVNVASVPPYKSPSEMQNSVARTTEEWAKQWGGDCIRVNCVVPWLIQSDSKGAALQDKEYQESSAKFAPRGEMGVPRDVAGVIAFLCLPIAGFITKQLMHVDGGYSGSEASREHTRTDKKENPIAKHSLDDAPSGGFHGSKEGQSSEIAVLKEQVSGLSEDDNNEVTLATPSLEDFCRELEEGESVSKDSSGMLKKAGSIVSEESLAIRPALSADARWEEWKNKRKQEPDNETNNERGDEEDAVKNDTHTQQGIDKNIEGITAKPTTLQSSLKESSFVAQQENTVVEKQARDDLPSQNVRVSGDQPRQIYNGYVRSVSPVDSKTSDKSHSVSFQESKSEPESEVVTVRKEGNKSKGMKEMNRLKEVRDKVRLLRDKKRDAGLPPHPPQKKGIHSSLRCVFPSTKDKSSHFDDGHEDNDFILYDSNVTYEI